MKLFIALVLSMVSFFVSGQAYFEGRIQYRYEVKTKSSRVDVTRLKQELGKGSTLTFKDGNFRHDYAGGPLEFELYNRRNNKSYSKKRGNDTIYWYDCSKGGKRIHELMPSGSKKNVLGIACNKLTIQYADHKKVEYYNSDSIRIDPQWFVAYKRDDQYKIDAIERSIYLRSELDFRAVIVISQATGIKREPVSMSVFDIPGDAILLEKE